MAVERAGRVLRHKVGGVATAVYPGLRQAADPPLSLNEPPYDSQPYGGTRKDVADLREGGDGCAAPDPPQMHR